MPKLKAKIICVDGVWLPFATLAVAWLPGLSVVTAGGEPTNTCTGAGMPKLNSRLRTSGSVLTFETPAVAGEPKLSVVA
jgi:hypothetical protein